MVGWSKGAKLRQRLESLGALPPPFAGTRYARFLFPTSRAVESVCYVQAGKPMRFMPLIIAVAVLFGGCDQNLDGPDTVTDAQTTDTPDTDTTTDATAPDNTAVNERDQDGATKTPVDQGETE